MTHISQTNQRNTRGVTLLIVVMTGILLFIWGNAFLGKHPVCIYYHGLGIPCPFCGLTRAVYEFMHFRFRTAWVFNPLVYLLVVWFVLELGCFIWCNNHSLFAFLKIFRWLLVIMALLFLLLRCFRYFPLP